MTWWGEAHNSKSKNPKFKNKFLVEFGNGGYKYAVKTVSKPSVTIEKKEYRMINHFYNYPGVPKWDPITIKFADAFLFNQDDFNRSVGGSLWEMLLATGYVTPSQVKSKSGVLPVVSPEKAASIAKSFGDYLKIHQLDPGKPFTLTAEAQAEAFAAGGLTGLLTSTLKRPTTLPIVDTWTLFNPIITKISWGDLDYGDDNIVECTLEIAYDWAEFFGPEQKAQEEVNIANDDEE